MVKRMLLYEFKSRGKGFDETDWKNILSAAKKAGNMRKKELAAIASAPVARILAATPYFTGCANPDQIAVLRIMDLLCGYRNKELFTHRPGQSIRDRLLTGICFPGGDPQVIEFAVTLLELISLNDHLADLQIDDAANRLNPINSNVSSFLANRKQLLSGLNSFNREIRSKYEKLLKTDLEIINWWVA